MAENKNKEIPISSLGFKIKRIREQRGLTQQELGLMCDFPSTTAGVRISQYEKNLKVPKKPTLKAIALALNVSEESLYNLENCDLRDYLSVYHLLFEIEDYWGLHPVKIGDKFYLEFGGPSALDSMQTYDHDLDSFLCSWYQKRNSYLSIKKDRLSKLDKKKADDDYAIWKFEYPNNEFLEHKENLTKQKEIEKLQVQIDELHTSLMAASMWNKLNDMVSMLSSEENIEPITSVSDFRTFLKIALEKGVPILYNSEEAKLKNDNTRFHILSIKTDDIFCNETNKKFYAALIQHINTLDNLGYDLELRLYSRNKELYVTLEVTVNDVAFIEEVFEYWAD